MREPIYSFNKKFPDSLKHNTIVIYINSPRREAYIMRYEQVYNRIKELCEERGWSQYRLIKESGIPQSSFYNMMDRESIPQLDMIQRICDGLNITLGDFFADDRAAEELSRDDYLFIEASRKLDADNRRRALAYMDGLIDLQNKS